MKTRWSNINLVLGGLTMLVPLAAHAEPDAPEADILVVGYRGNVLNEPAETGSRLGLTPLETPASVAILDGDVIRLRGDPDLVSAVTRTPGMTTAANPGNGGTALSARGFSGQGSVLQLVDGVRLFPVAGTISFPVEPGTIERVEILNGPASVLFGQGAVGGAINFINRQPTRERSALDLQMGYGSENSGHATAGMGGPINEHLAYRLDGAWRESEGHVDRGDSQTVALSGALRYQPAETLSITLRNDYGDQNPLRYFGTPVIDSGRIGSNRDENYNVADANLHYRDNHTLLTAEWNPSSSITVRNDLYRLTSYRLFKNLEQYCYVEAGGLCRNGANEGSGFDPAPAGTVYRFGNYGIVHDQVQYGDQATLRLATPINEHVSNDFLIGFDVNKVDLTYSHDFGSDFQEDVVDPFDFSPGLFFDTQGVAPRYVTETSEYAIFAEDRIKFGERFSVVAGLRSERDSVERRNIVYGPDGSTTEVNAFPNGMTERKLSNTTYRLGGVYQPTARISLYAQYSTGVDPLGTLATYTTSASQFYFTNAEAEQIEAGIKANILDDRGSVTLAGYRIVKRDLVAQRTPTSPVEQVGQRSSEGIEASLTLHLSNGLSIDANGTVLNARYDDFVSDGTVYTGNTPTNIPESTGNLWLRWSAERFAVQAGLRYVGDSFSDDANEFRIPGYTVVDAGVSFAINSKLAIDLHAYNLFDKDYVLTTYDNEQWILGRPLSFDVSVRAEF
jgi:iron complex outermembrane recepter protein